ncbi:MAG: carboxypeptidase regulatory-like domain-containing protein, partial [Chloroflexota bacterium]|nr:carboxypeptidase regulatory-like domain-containing protein [Chloroflexota bacterium]
LKAALRPTILSGTIRDAYTDQPIEGALVKASETISATTDASGRYELEGVPEAYQISVSAPGHEETRADIRRTTEQNIALRPTILRGMVTDAYSSKPVAGVDVTLGESRATTDAEGHFTLEDTPPDGELIFAREGYDEVRMPLERTTTLDVVMRPNVLEGVVRDAVSGAVLSDTLVIATPTYTGTAVASARTDRDGRYRLEHVPEGAFLKALHPGYRRGEVEVTAGGLTDDLKLQPFAARAIYVKANVAQSRDNVRAYLDIIDRTETNALVLDLKSDNLEDVGLIYYQSNVPLIRELGTSVNKMDLPWILAEAKKRNIYMIARIHVFAHDNALLKVRPEWYVQNTKTGKPWFADFGIAWLDTYEENVWDYNIQLALEAAQLGFDEIQFDYIRFPSDGNLTNARFKGPRDWKNNPAEMYDTIGRFMQRAQKAINDAGAYFSVDVFGYAAWTPQARIGQNLQVMGKYADYVCPMVYPSHFLYGELGLGNPSLHPFELVAHSMKQVKGQLQGEASRTGVRPWLQDFTLIWVPKHLIVEYGPKEVRAQIDAAEQNGATGWSLWDSDNRYTVEALKGPE